MLCSLESALSPDQGDSCYPCKLQINFGLMCSVMRIMKHSQQGLHDALAQQGLVSNNAVIDAVETCIRVSERDSVSLKLLLNLSVDSSPMIPTPLPAFVSLALTRRFISSIGNGNE